MSFPIFIASFIVIALASKQIGQFFASIKLPLITGYLFTGIIAGPFILDLISAEAAHNLLFIDALSLAFIAFAAGSELYLKELRGRFKSITWVTMGLVAVTFTLSGIAVFLLADHIPFMQSMSVTGQIAVAALAGSILVARSPSSAIAIVNELRAKGPFTQTALGVTVVMDVVVIFLFAFSAAAADLLLTTTEGFDPGLVLLLLVELPMSLASGYVVSRILQLILSTRLDMRLKSALILLVGFGVFVLSDALRDFTHENLPFEVLLEPLLICMIGGFVVTNFSRYRDEFLGILHSIGPFIYIIFFTLTGASLSLDILAAVWPITLVLVGVRLLGIFLGSLGGGIIAGDPMRHNRLGWMAYITQAGVGLGLAKEVAVEFPLFGDEFATLIISVIVINQIIGPPFFKSVIKRVGESRLPGQAEPDEIRNAVIMGIDDQSLALARQLTAHNWQVIMADTDPSHVERLAPEDVEERHMAYVNQETMSELVTTATDALIVMCGDDAKNYTACELAYEIGVPHLVVRLNDIAYAQKFAALDVLVVDPASAIVNLLDQFVRAPQSASLLMHSDPEHEVGQITLTNPAVHGLHLRDVRLPNDVVVLGITRDGQAIVPQGHTILHKNDEMTLIGHPRSLKELTLRLGY